MALSRVHCWLAAGIASLSLVSGCAGIEPTLYAAERPALDLRSYFDGPVDAWGVVQDRSGRVVRRFSVTIEGRWNGDVGVLDETFRYSDGTTDKRIWTLRRHGEGRYTGTAGDVVGEATGHVSGNAFRWQYTMALPVDGRVWHIDFDDWMFLIDEKVMLNRATMSKFGLRVGEVTLSFTKR